jgi:hypothetical protein
MDAMICTHELWQHDEIEINNLPIRVQLTYLDQINDKNEPYQHGCIYIHEISQLDRITHG